MQPLLFLAHRIPYPPNKGDKIRSYNLLKHLAANYSVYLGAFIDNPRDWQYAKLLERICAEVCLVNLNPRVAKLHSLLGLVTGEPLTLPYYRSHKLQEWVNKKLNMSELKRVFVFSSSMAQYVEGFDRDRMCCVIDFVDVDSKKWEQYSRSHGWPISWLYHREALALLRYERHIAAQFNASVFVSEKEANLFRGLAPEVADRVTPIQNGIDTEYFSPDREYLNPYGSHEKVLVFTGAMDYWANVDAAVWFAKEIFPTVYRRLPSARLYIVGSHPVSTVCALADLPGIRVTGTVTDIRPYLAYAHAAVAPLRIARGVQNKVLEAMAMGCPVLATKAAAEGISMPKDQEALVTDTPNEQVEIALNLLKIRNSPIGNQNRKEVSHRYNWSTSTELMAQLLDNAPAVYDRKSLDAAGFLESMSEQAE